MESAIRVADALFRLKNECVRLLLSGRFSESCGDLPPSGFVLIRTSGAEFRICDVLHRRPAERDKLLLLLELFSKGQVIEERAIVGVENWIVSLIGTAAPMLELAAKNKAMILTIPTEPEWRTDIINFEGRREELHNLWGQKDISALRDHCVNALEDAHDRFCIQFHAEFCDGALNDAPHQSLWERYSFFTNMWRAKKRNYSVDNKLLKNVGQTNCGILFELRCLSDGQRIFFVYRAGCSPEILVGGFYQKSESKSQNEAIETAKGRINQHLSVR